MTQNTAQPAEFELVIVGAGFAGLQMLYRARKRGLKVRLFEAGSGVGGTWYWNRYPGARVDLESLEYSYSFSEELQQEWEWTERYAAQPELQRYADHVTDRFDLRRDIRFDSRVLEAVFDEHTHRWTLRTSAGELVRAQFCVMATGLLSAPNKPKIDGIDSFRGPQLMTSMWPKQDIDLGGKRVGIIGTGSSGIQCIPELAKRAAHLTVFQRTPAFCIPARNGPLDPEYQRAIKARYPEVRQQEMQTFAGFVSLAFLDAPPSTQSALEVHEAERLAEYEKRWAAGGLCFYTAYPDLLMDARANESLAEFVRNKIRQRVKNPEVAEKLVPKSYPILTKRLCADTQYYETYDRDNVTLVDVSESPIERITPAGVQVNGQVHPLDVLVFATGFDAMSGALDRIDIRGRGGKTLKAHWKDGLSTFLGMMSSGFPNMIYMNGPGSPSAFFNPILLGEYQADWIIRCIETLRTRGQDCLDATTEAEAAWVAHSDEVAAYTLFAKGHNWYMGDNIPGKPRRMLVYLGGYASYREWCETALANGLQQFEVSAASDTAVATT